MNDIPVRQLVVDAASQPPVQTTGARSVFDLLAAFVPPTPPDRTEAVKQLLSVLDDTFLIIKRGGACIQFTRDEARQLRDFLCAASKEGDGG
jgi:hypothetical protein